jgi:quinol-cytochrome oxidoreductase complex cytochrome b subunit
MKPAVSLLGAAIDLNHPDRYVHWGFVLISVANLIVIVVMVALFVIALLLPFVQVRAAPAAVMVDDVASSGSASEETPERNWTGGVRRLGLRYLPPDKLLPDAQPAYVASWVYVFGVLTVGAMMVVVASGVVLAIFGPAWWHTSFVGHFINSVHLWSVELFMGFMVIHLWAKFWMAAWRGGRSFTWMTGVVCFLVAIFEAFTGYLAQTNFDSQWIAFEAKDGLNSGGIGAYFNAMNFGQALMLHIALLPLALVALVAVHVLLVRVHGVAPPIDAQPQHLGIIPPGPFDIATDAVTAPPGAASVETAPPVVAGG